MFNLLTSTASSEIEQMGSLGEATFFLIITICAIIGYPIYQKWKEKKEKEKGDKDDRQND
jgi:hypothetical protein